MFGSKKTEDKPSSSTSTPTAESNALNSLVKGTVVEGNVTAQNDIRVDGTIKGTLTCSAKVIIGPSGLIDGEVKCQNAMVEGKFYGKLRVTELLTVKESAEIVGDVTTGKLQISTGAIFNVTCNMKDTSGGKTHFKPEKEEAIVANGSAKK